MKINKILITFFTLTIIANNYVIAQEYYVDPKKYQQLAAMDRVGNAINQIYGLGNTSNLAGQYADEQQRIYEIQMANQAGVPYDEYLCNGDYVCMQRFKMQQQYMNTMNNYSNALRNQHMTIDANINHSGTVNVNNYNRYRY